jgi:hypothetical protein
VAIAAASKIFQVSVPQYAVAIGDLAHKTVVGCEYAVFVNTPRGW